MSGVSDFGQWCPIVNCKAKDTKNCMPVLYQLVNLFITLGEGKREEEEECELATLKLLDIYSRIGQ